MPGNYKRKSGESSGVGSFRLRRLFHDIENGFDPPSSRLGFPLDGNAFEFGRDFGKEHRRIVDEIGVFAERKRRPVRSGPGFERYSLEALESRVHGIRVSVEFLVVFAIVNGNVGRIIEVDKPPVLSVRVSSQGIPVAARTLGGRSDETDVVRRIGTPVEFEKSQLGIVVIPLESVSKHRLVAVLIDVFDHSRSRTVGGSSARPHDNDRAVRSAGRSRLRRQEDGGVGSRREHGKRQNPSCEKGFRNPYGNAGENIHVDRVVNDFSISPLRCVFVKTARKTGYLDGRFLQSI